MTEVARIVEPFHLGLLTRGGATGLALQLVDEDMDVPPRRRRRR